MWCAMGQCYEHEQMGLNDAAIRCYRRALANGDREGIALHKLVVHQPSFVYISAAAIAPAVLPTAPRGPQMSCCCAPETDLTGFANPGKECQLSVSRSAYAQQTLRPLHECKMPFFRHTCTRGKERRSRRRTTSSSTWRQSTP